MVAAGAAWAGGLDGDVSELASGALSAAHEHSVRDHTPSDPGAERDEDQVVNLASRAKAELAPGGGVGVVFEREGEADPRLQLVFQGDALYGVQIWGEDHLVFFREDEASDGQAHPVDLEPILHLEDGPGDALQKAYGRSRRRIARLLEDPTFRRDHTGGDLGSPYVHPYCVQPTLQSTTSSSACPEYLLR